MQSILKTTFENNGKTEYNDRVFEYPAFEVLNRAFSFILQPHSTKFWRFGIVLSKKREFEFNPSEGRYKNKELKFIQINVGERVGNQWQFPNRLELATTNVDNGFLNRYDGYEPLSQVILSIDCKEDGGIFVISYRTGPNQIFTQEIYLKDYLYFKISSWADFQEFELDCTIQVTDKNIYKTMPDKSYWLLKIRAQTWDVRSFKEGQITWFNTYDLQSQRRPEYELLLKAELDDLVIGYAYENYNAVVCIMQITHKVHNDPGRGEVVNMKIIKMIDPYIPLEDFQSNLQNGKDLEDVNSRRWFAITEEEYNAILLPKSGRTINRDLIPSYTAEGNHRSTSDQLDFEYDIKSFAKVISLKEVKPPLAIGLFGNWGSGKSFFMENLMVEIDKLQGSHDQYIESVVQVTFNSWHYSDSNLWASLITEIFDKLYDFSNNTGKLNELEKLSQTLDITRIQKAEIEIKKGELEDLIASLELERRKKREALMDLSGLELMKLIVKDKSIQADLALLNNGNVEAIFNQEYKIDQYLIELNKGKNKFKYFIQVLTQLKGRWIYVVAVAFGIYFISNLIYYIPYLSEKWQLLTGQIAGGLALCWSFLAKLKETWRPVSDGFKKVHDRLMGLKNTIESRPEINSPDVRETELQLAAIRDSLKELDGKIQDTQTALTEISSGKRLRDFLEQRSRDEKYSSQLGLISWIRKDFNKLDDLLRKQYLLSDEREKGKMNPENVQLKIDRIVLYIDDLDRCNEEIVVRVLEAVHLLLAFELFVVVVGVDPRWLKSSLVKKYTFFSKSKHGKDAEVSSYDYLEKIFQIPFTLKPITKKGREGLLTYLIRNDMEQKDIVKTINENVTMNETGNVSNSVIEVPTANLRVSAQTSVQFEIKKLSFTDDELYFMKEVSPLFGQTPRTINRFVNTYRILKAHGNFQTSRNYLPTLLLLAIIIGCSEDAQVFIRKIPNYNAADNLGELLKDTELKALKERLERCNGQGNWGQISVGAMVKNLDLVTRFSFRTLLT
jgi:hypothetical protein